MCYLPLFITDTFHLIRKLHKLSSNYARKERGQTSGRKRSDEDGERETVGGGEGGGERDARSERSRVPSKGVGGAQVK